MTEALQEWLAEAPGSATITVSAQDIARFVVAIGASDPAHFDEASARAEGYPAVVAPSLFYLAIRTGAFNLVPQAELHEEGTSLREVPPIAFTAAMAGETKVTLHRRFVAGDRVRVECTREQAVRKSGRSGDLTFVDYLYRYTDEMGEPIATERFTRIFR